MAKAAAKTSTTKAVPRATLKVKDSTQSIDEATKKVAKPTAAVVDSSSKSGDDTSGAAKNQADMLRKVDLIDKVVERTGVKKRDAKPAIEAALQILAEALLDGKTAVLPPMGKLKPLKSKELDGGAQAVTLKLRVPKPAQTVTTPPLAAE